jgi:hypothetical protein
VAFAVCRWTAEAAQQAEEKHLPGTYRALLAVLAGG